jgi:hypothetical protein
MAIDVIISLNLILCIAIFLLGYWCYVKRKSQMALFVGISFALFGISHIVALLGYTAKFEGAMIIVRLIAYLIVIFALYKLAFKK